MNRSMRTGAVLSIAFAMVVAVLAVFSCSRSSSSGSKPSAAAEDAARPAPDATAPRRARRGEMDVTFLVTSDMHFGYGGIEDVHAKLAPALDGIAGQPNPAALGGIVGAPRGVIVTGDLTEWGKVDEWERFLAWYGQEGADARVRYPIFEMIGNHDRVHGPWVGDQVARRHGGRYYSWDWDDLHLVALGEAPDDEGLAFLARDLERLEADVPVALFFHFALLGPFSTGNWFGEGDFKDRLARTIAGHEVIAIFHGHHHAPGAYRWHDVDVYKPGAVKNGPPTFAVVHVTDERMTVSWRDFTRGTWSDSRAKQLPK